MSGDNIHHSSQVDSELPLSEPLSPATLSYLAGIDRVYEELEASQNTGNQGSLPVEQNPIHDAALNARLNRLKEHLFGKAGLDSFIALILSHWAGKEEVPAGGLNDSWSLAYHANRRARIVTSTPIDMYASRLLQFALAAAMQRERRRDEDMANDIIVIRGWDYEIETRAEVCKELSFSRKVEQLCSDEFEGISVFLPLYEDEVVTQMMLADIDMFHEMVRADPRMMQLCTAGSRFKRRIQKGEEFPRAPWEYMNQIQLGALSQEELAGMLSQFGVPVPWHGASTPASNQGVTVAASDALAFFLATKSGPMNTTARAWNHAIQLSRGIHFDLVVPNEAEYTAKGMLPPKTLRDTSFSAISTEAIVVTELLQNFNKSVLILGNASQGNTRRGKTILDVLEQLRHPKAEDPVCATGFHTNALSQIICTPPVLREACTVARVQVTASIMPAFTELDMQHDGGKGAVITVSEKCVLLVAVCPDTEANNKVWEGALRSVAPYRLPEMVEAVTDISVVLVTHKSGLHIPPGTLYAAFTVVGGVTTVSTYMTPASLESAVRAFDLERVHSAELGAKVLTAVKLCNETGDGERRHAGLRCLCERFSLLREVQDLEPMDPEDRAFWTQCSGRQRCHVCDTPWYRHD